MNLAIGAGWPAISERTPAAREKPTQSHRLFPGRLSEDKTRMRNFAQSVKDFFQKKTCTEILPLTGEPLPYEITTWNQKTSYSSSVSCHDSGLAGPTQRPSLVGMPRRDRDPAAPRKKALRPMATAPFWGVRPGRLPGPTSNRFPFYSSSPSTETLRNPSESRAGASISRNDLSS